MYEYKDLAGITRIVIGALWIYIALSSLFALGTFSIEIAAPQADGTIFSTLFAVIALVYFLAVLATCGIVGRWIYRASANAHAINDAMTISPGWAVGWYFIPIASLFKPFQAMKDIWLASQYRGAWGTNAVPILLNWWWGLWIVSNVLGSISARAGTSENSLKAWIDIANGIVNVPAALLLMVIVRQIRDGQTLTIRHEIFA